MSLNNALRGFGPKFLKIWFIRKKLNCLFAVGFSDEAEALALREISYVQIIQ